MPQTFQIIIFFINSTNMRIEKHTPRCSLAFNHQQTIPSQQERVDPYHSLQLQEESSRGLPQVDLLSFQLSEEEEMLLDFLLPDRRKKQFKCLKEVNYSQFIVDSISQYQDQLSRFKVLNKRD